MFRVEVTSDESGVPVIKIVPQGFLDPRELPELIVEVEAEALRLDVSSIVLSGRLPVWAYSHIVAKLREDGFTVGVADPKLSAAIFPDGRTHDLGASAF